MHAGRVLDSDTPQALMRKRGLRTLEETFIAYLRDAAAEGAASGPGPQVTASAIERPAMVASSAELDARFSLRRLLSYTRREAMELRRDPIRATAMLGTVLLMLIMGYGISLDVEDLTYAVLDHDQTTTSQAYALNIALFRREGAAGRPADMDRRLRSGDISLAIEIPPDFGRDLARRRPRGVLDRRRHADARRHHQGLRARPACQLSAGPARSAGVSSAAPPTSPSATATTRTCRACRPWSRR